MPLVCLFVPLENFSLIWRHHYSLWKGCKFWPKLGIHGHWVVRDFNVPNLQWHGASVYDGHLWGPVTLTAVAERLAVRLSLFLRVRPVAAGSRTPNLPHARQTLEGLHLHTNTKIYEVQRTKPQKQLLPLEPFVLKWNDLIESTYMFNKGLMWNL